MQRGFKSRSEKSSLQFRREMKVPEIAPLSMRALAEHLEVIVKTPEQIPGLPANLVSVLSHPRNGWSALCLGTPQGHLIIHNPAHNLERQESDIAHELAHKICGHKQQSVTPFGKTGIFLRTFNKEQEEEASYLGGCLQLPRKALVHCLFRDMSQEAIATNYHASLEMVRYRINTSGANKILKNTRNRWHGNKVGLNGRRPDTIISLNRG